MIIFTIKLLNNVKRAIAGRNHPRQLAWGVAFGLVLGLLPHGNLVALAWLIVVLALNLNHSIVAVVAILSSFLAQRLDPYSHRVGEWLLAQPLIHNGMMAAWQWPLVPWTSLNNSVVLGSFTIALAAMCPTYLITYPMFRYLSQRSPLSEPEKAAAAKKKLAAKAPGPETSITTRQVIMVDPGHNKTNRSHLARLGSTTAQPAPATDDSSTPLERLDAPERVAVETRIDIIRLADCRSELGTGTTPTSTSTNQGTGDDSNDEAFRYLLHQLRDSQQRNAA
jgi:uncharacterized protein (TIGR03546 family)